MGFHPMPFLYPTTVDNVAQAIYDRILYIKKQNEKKPYLPAFILPILPVPTLPYLQIHKLRGRRKKSVSDKYF
jgi:hypothetical protein